MVAFASLIGTAALLAGYASALPMPDSSSGNEVAVSAPDGVVVSDTAALASQLATAMGEAMMTMADSMASMTMDASMSSETMAAAMSMGDSMMSVAAGMDSMAMASQTMMGESMATASMTIEMSPPSMGTQAPSWNSGQMYSMASSNDMTSAAMSAAASSATISYGSGSSNWNGETYQDCVNQCVASFGAPPSMSTGMSSSSSSSANAGNGVTHTVIVAPTQGVLRFVPFTTTANVGDTVLFKWQANNHTVTKSSELTPCNKTMDAPFATGEQNMPFTFTQVVNDTNPTFFYCGTPTHCEKGMFGVINAPSVANNANTSVSSMMSSMVSMYPSVSAMNTYAMNATSGNSYAASWGSTIDIGSMPAWSQQYIAENVQYTRAVLGMNPSAVQNGLVNIDPSTLVVPQDLAAAAAANTTASSTMSMGASMSGMPASSMGSSLSNGAGRTAVSGGLGVAALAVLFLAL